MNILAISDTHLEFHRDNGAEFIESLPTDGVDVLVLAGDICSASQIPDMARAFADRYPHVVYVFGNHEFYGAERCEALVRAGFGPGNFHFLEAGSVTVDGQRFIGGTLWFEELDIDHGGMNDFYVIPRFGEWVYESANRTKRHISVHAEPGDIVVTHHLPSYASVHPKYRGSPLNAFFVNDCTGIIRANRPKLWIHGHTHESCDYQLWDTRVVCNPYGYHGHETNHAFNRNLLITL